MASNEEIIRKLYEVAETEPKRFRPLFTEKGYWWDVPAGVRYEGDEVARAADIYSVAFPDMHRELHDLYVDDDIVVVRLTLHGTHKGDLPTALGTIPATGKEFHVPSSISSVSRTGRSAHSTATTLERSCSARSACWATWRLRSESNSWRRSTPPSAILPDPGAAERDW